MGQGNRVGPQDSERGLQGSARDNIGRLYTPMEDVAVAAAVQACCNSLHTHTTHTTHSPSSCSVLDKLGIQVKQDCSNSGVVSASTTLKTYGNRLA